MKITKVKIENCFNLQNVDLTLKDGRCLIVGPNGSGKTNIIKCITFVVKQLTECQNDVLKLEKPEDKHNKKESSIKLCFQLNRKEMSTLLKMRLWRVLSNCCTLLEQAQPSNVDRKLVDKRMAHFLEIVFPRLVKLLDETSSQSIINRSGSSPKSPSPCSSDTGSTDDINIEWTRYSGKVRIEFSETRLPRNDSKEKEIIEDAMKELCGPQISGTLFKIQLDRDEVTRNLSDALQQFLNNKRFLTIERHDSTQTWFPSNIHSSQFLHQERHDITDLKDLQDLRKEIFGDKDDSLDTLIAHYLTTSLCIVSQSRGSLPTECGSLFWDISKVEERLANISLSKVFGPPKRKDVQQFEKVENAMRRIAGLDIKVSKGGSPFGNVEITTTQRPMLSRWSLSDSKHVPRKESSPLCVMLKKCHASEDEWESLLRCSRGERELLVILSAYYLSESANVILDEPGHSFHPPQQAQLRRLLEEDEDEKVLLAITHSSDMIGPKWIPNVYHMSERNQQYSARLIPRAFFDLLDENMKDFLMGAEIRRIFFSSGVIFVEGVTDQRVLKVLREVKLEKLSKSSHHGATETQRISNGWEIIPMEGCGNWLKSYTAASRLGIPFVIVLDQDIIKIKENKSGKRKSNFLVNIEVTRKKKQLPEELTRLEEELCKHVETEESYYENARKKSKQFNLWIWNGNLEDNFFSREAVTNKMEQDDEIWDRLSSLNLLPKLKSPCSVLDSSGAESVDDDPPQQRRSEPDREEAQQLALARYENSVHNIILKEIEELHKLLNDVREKIAQEPEYQIKNEFKDLANRLKSKLIQLPGQFNKRGPNTSELDPSWDNVASQLHEGKWKFIDWKTLKTMVQLAIEEDDNPLNQLWMYLEDLERPFGVLTD